MIDYPDENNINVTEIYSDQQIITEYWVYWYIQMCKKFGKDYVLEKFTVQDCINDWVTVNWAIKIDK